MEFSQSETEYRRLRDQLDSGQLSEAEFKARLQDLMVEDEQGRWWMIGYETGQWYVHDGEKWLPAQPPGLVPPQVAEPSMAAAEPAVVAASAAASTGNANGHMTRTRPALALIIVAWALCAGFWGYLYENVGIYGSTRIVAAGAWFLAGLAAGVAVRLVESALRWRYIVLGAFVWGVCSLLILPEVADVVPFVVRFTLAGLVGGLAMGLVVKQALAPMRWYHVLIIAVAWAVAFFVEFELTQFVINAIPESLNPVAGAVGGALGGAIGGGVTLWQTRQAQNSAARKE